MIDPPWPIAGAVLPYMDARADALKALPVGELAAARCHVHLWTLPNSYHRSAYDIVEHWGFRVVSEFVWCKTQVGRGHYWRMSHEILLTAVQDYDTRTYQALTGDDALTPTGIRICDHWINGFGRGVYASHAFSLGVHLTQEHEPMFRGEACGRID